MVAEVSIVMMKLKKIILTILKVIAVIFTVGLIPALLYFFFAKKVTSGEWLGFFGTYFGSAISIGFAYINTEQQLKKTYEKEIVDNLRDFLRSFEFYLNSLYDIQEARDEWLNKSRNIYNYKEMSSKILNVLNRTDSLLVELDSIMNQLKGDETEQINPAFKAWFEGYHSIYYIKSICNDFPANRMQEGVFMVEFDNNIANLNIESFIDQAVELKLAIANVYKKRLKKVIS